MLEKEEEEVKYEICMEVTLSKVFEVEADSEDAAWQSAFDTADHRDEWEGAERSSPEILWTEDVTGLSDFDKAFRAIQRAGIDITREQLQRALDEVRETRRIRLTQTGPAVREDNIGESTDPTSNT